MPFFGGNSGGSLGPTVEISEIESLAKGALIVGDGDGAPSIFPAGVDGSVLIFDSSEASGVRAGIPTGTDANYVHTQAVASSLWTVDHMLGKRVSIVVTDDLGEVINGDILYVSNNQLTISFGSAISGYCYCN